MKARTKIENKVAASNEKLTAISPKCSHGQCGKWQDISASELPHTSVRVANVADTSTIREKASQSAALIAVLALKSRTPSNEL